MKVNRQGQSAILSKEDEISLILVFCEQHEALRNIALLQTGINTGLRINELRLLDIADVLDAQGNFRNTFALKAENTKGKRSRTVFINKAAEAALKEYLATRPDAKPADPLFKSCGRGRISRSMACRLFEYAFVKAGIKGASSHSMRRTFITRLHDMGVPLGVIRDLAGHSDLSMTSKYIDVKDSAKQAAVLGLMAMAAGLGN